LMDFGLVKAMEGSAAITSQGTLLGSPEYMAPEQADPNRTAEIGPAADLYALGIVAYRMLTGRVPFPGNTPATLNAHEHKPVPPPRSLRPDLPKQVARALLKMLAKAPEDRFVSARAFVARMRTSVEYTQRYGYPGKLPVRVRKTIPRKEAGSRPRLAIAPHVARPAIQRAGAVALVLLLLAASVIYVSRRTSDWKEATPSAVAPGSIYSGLITYLSQDERGSKSLHALNPNGAHITLIPSVADVMILAVSPDRSYLAIASNEEGELSRSTTYPRFIEGSGVSLMVISADGQEQTKVISDVPLFDAAYAPDGRLLVAVLRGSKITYTVCQTDGSDPRELYSSDNVFATPEAPVEIIEMLEEP
jgi:serine/threonine protein kinase